MCGVYYSIGMKTLTDTHGHTRWWCRLWRPQNARYHKMPWKKFVLFVCLSNRYLLTDRADNIVLLLLFRWIRTPYTSFSSEFEQYEYITIKYYQIYGICICVICSVEFFSGKTALSIRPIQSPSNDIFPCMAICFTFPFPNSHRESFCEFVVGWRSCIECTTENPTTTINRQRK